MNNKGFTLIELIMVVAILSLLVMIFTPNVMNLINKNNTNTYNDTIKSIENAAKVYVSDNRYDTNFLSNYKCETTDKPSHSFDISKLIETGALSKIPENPCSNKKLDFDETGKDIVEVTFDCSTKQFSYKFKKYKNESGTESYSDTYNEGGTSVLYSKIEQNICAG